ncbi:MAG: membrane protein insertase YidC [Treponema sp.]|nr:membrane protein insertase YidC [Treponema sp.]
MLSILYNIIISPLELVFEFVFEILFRILGQGNSNQGFAVIGVSIAISLLTLPLYRRADAVQQKERDIQKKLSHWVSHIKKTFKGDERYMMLQAYYRENGYSPIMALNGSLSLLLEIPFFMAAYHFLSHLEVLNGASFGLISDLGKADGLIKIGNFSINVLPILMTLINYISSAIYLKGFPVRDKIQTYGMALIFLVLLYNSPSGLVVYWTCNNIFSLVKNVFYKLKNPKKVLWVMSCCFIAVVILFAFLKNPHSFGWKKSILISFFFVYINFPILRKLYCEKKNSAKKFVFDNKKVIYRTILSLSLFTLVFAFAKNPASFGIKKCMLFVSCVTFLCLPIYIKVIPYNYIFSSIKNRLCKSLKLEELSFKFLLVILNISLFAGVFLSSSLIASSPVEFSMIEGVKNPINFVLINFALFMGIFCFWPAVIFNISNSKYKKALIVFFLFILFASLFNVFLFNFEYGQIDTNFLISENVFSFTKYYIPVFILMIFVSMFIFFILNKKIQYSILISVLISQSCYSFYKISYIENSFTEFLKSKKEVKICDNNFTDNSFATEFSLSKKNKNVVIFFLDRAVNDFFPYALEELPALREQFRGFSYYPNTVSFGNTTISGFPGLAGGYEYSMEEMNKRENELLPLKHNEALLVMPTLFSNAGFKVTISDTPFGNYKTEGDFSIYKNLKNVNAKSLSGKYAKNYMNDFSMEMNLNKNLEACEKNITGFILLQILPVNFRKSFYESYMKSQELNSESGTKKFASEFSTLYYLAKLTDFNSESDNFIFLSSDLTHTDNVFLNEDYTCVANYIFKGMYDSNDETVLHHYHVNMAALKQLGKYFDYLRENDAYDNTRIIIVSDHAMYMPLHEFEHFGADAKACIPAQLHPLLLFKDFNSNEDVKTDKTFMTNADTLFLAKKDLKSISNVNPFTQKELVQEKKDGVNVSNVQGTEWNWNEMNVKTQFKMPENNEHWYHVLPGNVYDKKNWIKHSDWEKNRATNNLQ